MNETERQIVAWLQAMSKDDFARADRFEDFPHSPLAAVYRLAAETKVSVANAIDLGEHRDKQDG